VQRLPRGHLRLDPVSFGYAPLNPPLTTRWAWRSGQAAMRFYRAIAGFLSERLRATTGGPAELDEGLLTNVQQAGERFIRLVNLARAPE
jgi:hypothetical protein